MTLDDLITEIKDRFERAKEDMRESQKAGGTSSPGFNQDLGHHDALGELLEWIEDQS